MKLVEAEGSHTRQNTYSSLDVHLGQSYSVLVTADQPVRDYYIVVSSRFTSPVLTTTAVLHYSGSSTAVKGVPPGGPTFQVDYSLFQARSIRWDPHLSPSLSLCLACMRPRSKVGVDFVYASTLLDIPETQSFFIALHLSDRFFPLKKKKSNSFCGECFFSPSLFPRIKSWRRMLR